MRGRLAAAAVLTVLPLWSAGAWAHAPGPAALPPAPLTTGPAGLDASQVAWSLAVLAAAALLIGAVRGRRTGRVVLVALVLWMGFEAAAHAVHHLGQPAEEARCAIASVNAHGSGIPSETHPSVSLLVPEARMASDLELPAHGHGLPVTHEGRAPPHFAL